MRTFALENINAVRGTQKFDKLIVDGVAPFDEFEKKVKEQFISEIHRIYASMNDVANLKSLPKNKFHFYDDKKGEYREFEFKSKHLRVYGITKPGGKIIILGGTKAKQKDEQSDFRRLKKEYLESIKTNDL